MASLKIVIVTHSEDDLRGGGWATFGIKVAGHGLRTERITPDAGLPGGSVHTAIIEVPELTDPENIELFQLTHVGQVSWPQTDDNWSMQSITVTLNEGRFRRR